MGHMMKDDISSYILKMAILYNKQPMTNPGSWVLLCFYVTGRVLILDTCQPTLAK